MTNISNLTHKYRPMVFSDVLEQETTIKILKNMIRLKKFTAPLMFSGIYGGGKTTLARIFSRAVLCTNITADMEPCNTCASCLSFLEGSNLAYNEIDAASNSGVDSIRKLREDANTNILGNSDKKVVVVDECHSISRQGNEALLKQLEENSGDQLYIFCTTAPESMQETVRSRCFEFTLKNIPAKAIYSRLESICTKENIPFEKEALEIIADKTAPHVRDAIKTLDYFSNLESVTKENIEKHYKVSLEFDLLKILLNLKDNLEISLNLSHNLLRETTVVSIYEGLITMLIKLNKLELGISNFNNESSLNLAKEILAKYSDVAPIMESLLKRNRYVTNLTLESDIILLNKKLNGKITTFPSITVSGVSTTVILNPTPTLTLPIPTPPHSASPETEASLQKEQYSAKTEVVQSLEETTAIIARYKSKDPKVAMMMAKAKSSSSKNSTNTVEFKNEVKDFKQDISKQEIREFLKNKRS